ncbi:MAG TPA: inositol monophosphatase family protein [Acidimicrobiales bacterium]|nr:inositol monophosphatase family protein [Acidimicrobiales bacterium]
MAELIDRVGDAVRRVSADIIEPRFRSLAAHEVEEKSPGQTVTVVDREAEAALEAELGAILPGVPVVGEEACSGDPSRLAALGSERAWVVDPLDGTGNFVIGSPDWAVMVALLAGGEAVASWIWQSLRARMYVAERGAGASCNGEVLRSRRPRAEATTGLRGAVLSRFMDRDTAAGVRGNAGRFAEIRPGRFCSGVEYPAVIEGEEDFALFWRTLPWDHIPGVLLVEEAGGRARRPDGSAYRGEADRPGLLVAADAPTWELARQLLA